MKWYYYQNADTLPWYFDDIVDTSENPPYSYRIELKVKFATEFWYGVFDILARALFYMKYGTSRAWDWSVSVGLAAEYITNLLAQSKIKVKITSEYEVDNEWRCKPKKFYIFQLASEANLMNEALLDEWEKCKEKKEGSVDVFLFHGWVLIVHPDDQFYDMLTPEDIDLEYSFFLPDPPERKPPTTIIRV